MKMSGKKTKIRKLKKKIAKLKAKLASYNSVNVVSPLAPKSGFPDLPPISGVCFSAFQAGIKYKSRDDVMLVKCCAGSSVAGVFTQSSTRSASVLDCQVKLQQYLPNDQPVIILANSGNSNAFTGIKGAKSVQAICESISKVAGTQKESVFTASTGVIGEPLPHERIINVVEALHDQLSKDAIEPAARAIMTTDTFPKAAASSYDINGETVHISGFAKGSGMIAPDMATMLVYIFTNVDIEQNVLQSMVSKINDQSFNAITVDSDTSTSDSMMVVATAQTKAAKITDAKSKAAQVFSQALKNVMIELSHLVVKDGEGASKFITINVSGAKSENSAKKIGRSIANSPLVKTAIAGEDPNWGRIVMAVGKSGEPADRDTLKISFGKILVAEKGWVSPEYSESAGATYMKNSEIEINVDIGVGSKNATVWTCDLTHQYITINADYRS